MIQRLIAEVSVRPSVTGKGFDWYLFAPGHAADQGMGNATTATEAVWRSVASLGANPGLGRIGVLSPDGSQVAYAAASAVPQYEFLRWQPTIVQQVDLDALALGSAIRTSP